MFTHNNVVAFPHKKRRRKQAKKNKAPLNAEICQLPDPKKPSKRGGKK